MILVKNMKFARTFFFFFFQKKTLDMTFHDVLERKEGFLDYKKSHFNIFEKYGVHPRF